MRPILIMAVWLAWSTSASACDICGCSMGSNYFGILPQFHRHFIGLRWSEQHSQSAHDLTHARLGEYATEDRFRTVDLIGRFYPVKRIQLLVLAPYQDFQRVEGQVITRNRGLGDLSLSGTYILFDTGDSLKHRWRHNISLGGGIKLPTGRSNVVDSEGELLHQNLQPGSGSFDFMVQLAYTVRKGNWGLSSDLLGRLNTANKKGYYFGNRISGSARLFYQKNFGKTSVLPNLGLFVDASEPSAGRVSAAEGTGGWAALSTFGLDFYRDKFSLGYTLQLPVAQNLGNGKVLQRNRWMATFNYIF